MDEYAWIKLSLCRIFILTIIIVAAIGLIIGKVVEANIYLEILKWAGLAVVCAVLAAALLSPVVAILDYARDQLYPEYGKKWWIKWIKNGFKSKK